VTCLVVAPYQPVKVQARTRMHELRPLSGEEAHDHALDARVLRFRGSSEQRLALDLLASGETAAVHHVHGEVRQGTLEHQRERLARVDARAASQSFHEVFELRERNGACRRSALPLRHARRCDERRRLVQDAELAPARRLVVVRVTEPHFPAQHPDLTAKRAERAEADQLPICLQARQRNLPLGLSAVHQSLERAVGSKLESRCRGQSGGRCHGGVRLAIAGSAKPSEPEPEGQQQRRSAKPHSPRSAAGSGDGQCVKWLVSAQVFGVPHRHVDALCEM
jgi:hypothetical protein